jgi:hypothetical protein
LTWLPVRICLTATAAAHPLISQLCSNHISLHHQQLAASLWQRSSERLAIRKVQLYKLDVGQCVAG